MAGRPVAILGRSRQRSRKQTRQAGAGISTSLCAWITCNMESRVTIPTTRRTAGNGRKYRHLVHVSPQSFCLSNGNSGWSGAEHTILSRGIIAACMRTWTFVTSPTIVRQERSIAHGHRLAPAARILGRCTLLGRWAWKITRPQLPDLKSWCRVREHS